MKTNCNLIVIQFDN